MKWLRWTSSSSTLMTSGIGATRSSRSAVSTNPGTTWAPSMTVLDCLAPSTAARSMSACTPTATAVVCSRNPTMTLSAGRGGGSRRAESASKEEVYSVGMSSRENSARMTSRMGSVAFERLRPIVGEHHLGPSYQGPLRGDVDRRRFQLREKDVEGVGGFDVL